ncbi:keratin, type I cytoskeletal 10-like [Impatiens glandulifera]|uniref:keratin, type I cytoskeletal 10-like n=1 Tax=Impatiens glandulifera TaxID=253017 RepID=UPI001FB13A9D|nr:keratin, type I cytoskeletal 10-like [Impatiens glandulifera]
MDVSTNHADTDEQAAALLIEFGNLSAEERCLLAQPLVEQNKEPVQENTSLEEEEIIQELVQALVTQEEEIVEEIVQTPNEKEVVKSPMVRIGEAQEKEAEVSQPEIIRSEGEPSTDKDAEEESSSSEREQYQNARTVKPLPFPDINAGNLYENILNSLDIKSNLYERFQRVEEELEEEERNRTRNESEKDEPEQSLQIHTEVNPIQSMEVDSQDNSSNEGSSVDGTKLLKLMISLLTSLQKNVITMGSNMLFSRQSELMSLEKQINLDNHREVMESMELFKSQMIEIQGSLRRSDGERLEYADSIARNFKRKRMRMLLLKKNKLVSPKVSPVEEVTVPTKGGGGRSGGDRRGRSNSGGRGGQSGSDRGGRTSGGVRGGRSSGSGRGGRALPPFRNLLTGQEMLGEAMSYEGTHFPIDPRFLKVVMCDG